MNLFLIVTPPNELVFFDKGIGFGIPRCCFFILIDEQAFVQSGDEQLVFGQWKDAPNFGIVEN